MDRQLLSVSCQPAVVNLQSSANRYQLAAGSLDQQLAKTAKRDLTARFDHSLRLSITCDRTLDSFLSAYFYLR